MRLTLRVPMLLALACALTGSLAGLPTAFAADPPPRDLLLIDPARIADLQLIIRAEVTQRSPAKVAVETALAALQHEADKALAMKPVSVMDKGVTPPSGDKHDYMSQARISGRIRRRRTASRTSARTAIAILRSTPSSITTTSSN
jgi:hypothetical protein